jgi:hypothetical protein
VSERARKRRVRVGTWHVRGAARVCAKRFQLWASCWPAWASWARHRALPQAVCRVPPRVAGIAVGRGRCGMACCVPPCAAVCVAAGRRDRCGSPGSLWALAACHGMMCAAVCRRVPPRVAGIAVGVGGMACVKLPQVAVSAMKHCEPMGLRCVCMGVCVCVCVEIWQRCWMCHCCHS